MTDYSGKRVLFVSHWDWVLFNFRLPIAVALRQLGAEVIMVCPAGKYTERLRSAGFRHIEWRMQRRSLNPAREVLAIARLCRIYREQRPDLVHHFTAKPNLYGGLAARIAHVPTTVNMFSGLGFLFSESSIARVLRVVVTPFLRIASNGTTTWTIAQTDDDRRRLLKRGIGASDRFVVVPGSGVDTTQFAPVGGEQPRYPPVVIMASRLIEEKGVRQFVEAAGHLREAGVAAHFLLAGEPDEGNPGSLRMDEVRKWHADGVIEYLGHCDNMAELLRQADVAAFPSYYGEGVPRFLLEAAASGLALVATSMPGCDAVVRDGWNGFLVPPRDPAALASALQRLLDDSSLRTTFGARSRTHAVEVFDERHIIQQYLKPYEAAWSHQDSTIS